MKVYYLLLILVFVSTWWIKSRLDNTKNQNQTLARNAKKMESASSNELKNVTKSLEEGEEETNLIPKNSRLIKIIVNNGKIIERVYQDLNKDYIIIKDQSSVS